MQGVKTMKRNLIKTLIVVSAVFVLAIGYKSYNIIIQPFPLVSMEHIKSNSDFNKKPVNGNMDFEFQELIPELVAKVRKRVGADLPIVKLPVHRKLISTSTAMHQYPEGIYPICSEHAKYLVYLAKDLGINARVIWMQGHTTAEVFHSRHGWVMVDTYQNQIFKHKQNGAYASVTDLVNNYEDYRLIIPVPGLPIYRAGNIPPPDHSPVVYKNQELIVEIDYDDVYRMPLANRSATFLLKTFFVRMDMHGKQWVRQNSEKVGNLNLQKIINSTYEELF